MTWNNSMIRDHRYRISHYQKRKRQSWRNQCWFRIRTALKVFYTTVSLGWTFNEFDLTCLLFSVKPPPKPSKIKKEGKFQSFFKSYLTNKVQHSSTTFTAKTKNSFDRRIARRPRFFNNASASSIPIGFQPIFIRPQHWLLQWLWRQRSFQFTWEIFISKSNPQWIISQSYEGVACPKTKQWIFVNSNEGVSNQNWHRDWFWDASDGQQLQFHVTNEPE